MPEIECEVSFIELYNDHGDPVDGCSVKCGECGHVTESYGTHEGSIKRCMALLREECPEGMNNFYIDGG